MKLHYFDAAQADADDILLSLAKGQGYVPPTCLLGGMVVMTEVNAGRDPCAGCAGPREKCHGRSRSVDAHYAALGNVREPKHEEKS